MPVMPDSLYGASLQGIIVVVFIKPCARLCNDEYNYHDSLQARVKIVQRNILLSTKTARINSSQIKLQELMKASLTLAFSNSLVRAASGFRVRISVWLRNMSL